MNIIELMTQIKENSVQFLCEDCIFQLRAFLRGFVLAKNTQLQMAGRDQKILEDVDKEIRKAYHVLPTAVISIEEILDDYEGDNAFEKYLGFWSSVEN